LAGKSHRVESAVGAESAWAAAIAPPVRCTQCWAGFYGLRTTTPDPKAGFDACGQVRPNFERTSPGISLEGETTRAEKALERGQAPNNL